MREDFWNEFQKQRSTLTRDIWSEKRRGEGASSTLIVPEEATLETSPDRVEGQNSQLLSQSWKSLSSSLYSRHIRIPSHERTCTRDMQRRKFLLVFLFSPRPCSYFNMADSFRFEIFARKSDRIAIGWMFFEARTSSFLAKSVQRWI